MIRIGTQRFIASEVLQSLLVLLHNYGTAKCAGHSNMTMESLQGAVEGRNKMRRA